VTWLRIRLLVRLLLAALLLGASQPASSTEIGLSDDYGAHGFTTLTHYGSDGTVEWADVDQLLAFDFPYLTIGTGFGGDSSSMGVVDLSPAGFDIGFEIEVAATPGSRAYSSGQIYFTVDALAGYAFSGGVSVYDPLENTYDLHYFARLRDTSSGQVMFESNQLSEDILEQAYFNLGEENGTAFNLLIGSMTGSLMPGVVYELDYMTDVTRAQMGFGGRTSLWGDLNMTLTSVPEPSTAILLGLGLLGLGLRRDGDDEAGWA
jgi:hypothetical protein